MVSLTTGTCDAKAGVKETRVIETFSDPPELATVDVSFTICRVQYASIENTNKEPVIRHATLRPNAGRQPALACGGQALEERGQSLVLQFARRG